MFGNKTFFVSVNLFYIVTLKKVYYASLGFISFLKFFLINIILLLLFVLNLIYLLFLRFNLSDFDSNRDKNMIKLYFWEYHLVFNVLKIGHNIIKSKFFISMGPRVYEKY